MWHKEMAEIIKNNGGRLYYVGGYVRDKLMGKAVKDIDFCIVGLTAQKFKELFSKAFLKGSFFPVFQLNNCEFAFARKEIKIGIGHKDFSFDTSNITLEDDLIRRDVTINSIAQDVLTDEIIDPFGGKKDLKNNTLRATSEHFIEDPLRVYRVAQFASRFNFSIEENTKKLMKSMKNELSSLSSERVFEELRKALSSKAPSIFFDVLKEFDLLDIHFKEINDLIGITQPAEYHPEGDVYTHSLLIANEVSNLSDDSSIVFAALLHDLGKGLTPKDILPHHYMHDKNSEVPVRNLCNRLKVPNSWYKLAKVVALEHMKAGIFNSMSIAKKVSFLERNFKYLKQLEQIARIDSKNPDLSFSTIGEKMFEEINGKNINLPNSPEAQNILHSERVKWLRASLKQK